MRRRVPTPPERALLLAGTLFAREDAYIKAMQHLENCLGEIIMEGPVVPWDFSEHYKQELGEPIFRRFIFFRKLTGQDELAATKLKTCEIENILSVDGKRTINIDPGYLTVAKLVLASTKDYSHRIYLSDGIFAEVTLAYNKNNERYIPFAYTYRDYCDERYLNTFSMARKLLLLLSKR